MNLGERNGDQIRHKFNIEAGNFTLAGEASSHIKRLLRQLGVEAAVTRRIAIAAYESEMNMVIHSMGGSLELIINPREVVMIAQDKGPGIEDIELAMKEGYSTASDKIRELGFGAGMGLPNIKRCTDKFYIESKLGEGTRLEASFILN